MISYYGDLVKEQSNPTSSVCSIGMIFINKTLPEQQQVQGVVVIKESMCCPLENND